MQVFVAGATGCTALASILVGPYAIYLMCDQRGLANAKAKQLLRCAPASGSSSGPALGPAGVRQTAKTGRHHYRTPGTDDKRDGQRAMTKTGKTKDQDRPRQQAKTTGQDHQTRLRWPPPPRVARLPPILPWVVCPQPPRVERDGAGPWRGAGPPKEMPVAVPFVCVAAKLPRA